jgi:lipid-binding SYLF domain-containing protein
MDFRAEADARAARSHALKVEKEEETAKAARSPVRKPPRVFEDSASHDVDGGLNALPNEAKLAEIDYNWNGGRARSNTGDFVPPRWVPDEEMETCSRCRSDFDWVNRRHHCRHCGAVFCQNCSPNRSLLPVAFGERDPQRVCVTCEIELRPLQTSLTNTIANHQCANSIDVSGQCTGRYFNLPYANDLAGEIRKAAYSTHNLFNLEYIKDKAIPLELLSAARGIAFLTVVKVGMVLAPKVGTGCVIAKLPDGRWSAPSAISTLGCNWGLLVGADITDYVIILNTPEAVDAFSGSGNVSVGAGIEIAAGPVGRGGGASFNVGTEGYAPAFSYAHSRGLYAGMGLEGSIIMARHGCNYNFYGQELESKAILRGAVPPPRAAQPLYDTLYHALTAGPAPTYIPKYSASMPVHLGESDHEMYSMAGGGAAVGAGYDINQATGGVESNGNATNSAYTNSIDNNNTNNNVRITMAATTPMQPQGGRGGNAGEGGGGYYSGVRERKTPNKRGYGEGGGDGHLDHFDAALHTGGMFDIPMNGQE